ncbi:MAG: CBS domain-containing protein [Betaproteobacteria bacterium]|nr:CBS domain-containing protein [Betaproteobacteria bacterium]
MDVELLEVRDFLAAHPPWDRLPPPALDALPRQLSVRYLRRGSAFPPTDEQDTHLYVIRQGAVEIRGADGQLLDKLAEGDIFGATCGDGAADVPSGHCSEDTLVYMLACDRVARLRAEYAAFDAGIADSPAQRLRHALETLASSAGSGASLMATEVGTLINRAPVCAGPDTSILEAARIMTAQRVSSLLITRGNALLGVVTDRDLRTRCIAEGVPVDAPVDRIMTANVHSVSSGSAAFRALMAMTRLNIHHLPVTEHGQVMGVVTATDLMRREASNPVYLTGAIHRAADVEALRDLSARIPDLQVRLATAGASARQTGEAISTITDAITTRLLQLAEAELGPAPVEFVWVAGGSQARHEQTSHSDQDNALILSDEARPEHDPYFEALARRVNDGLHRCGFVYCPGDVMAKNPEWRQPVQRWREYFRTWIQRPEQKALMLASVFFDLRAVHGRHDLLDALQRETLGMTRENTIFLAHMAANALSRRPPVGFFRDFVLIAGGEHDRTFDVKHRGIVPVVDLARHYALSAGAAEINTIDRLRATAGQGPVSAEGARDLEDAWEFVGTLRLRHQSDQLRNGLPPDNFLAPDSLSALERRQLRDAFRVIATMQTSLERQYPGGRVF